MHIELHNSEVMKIKRNIAEFIPALVDGGAETLVKDYALLLDKEKFNVICIVIRMVFNTANTRLLVGQGIKIIPIYRNNCILAKIIQKLNSWWYPYYRLKKILKQEQIEVLHTHLGILKYVSKIRKSIKYINLIYTCHNVPQYYLSSDDVNGMSARKLLRDNNLHIVALHEEMRQEINTLLGIDSTVVIRNGINFERFQNLHRSKTEVRCSLGIPQDSFVVGHIGRFEDQKNHSLLVEIFEELYHRRKDAFLLMVGTGELLNQTVNSLNDKGLEGRYHILSHRTDIPEILRAMDVFVFPSKFEGLSIALVEAQCSGLRCVVSDAIPNEELLSEHIFKIGLKEPVSRWCEAILDFDMKSVPHGNIDEYDMRYEIKRLEQLYLNGSKF